jgi:hypothetical protein
MIREKLTRMSFDTFSTAPLKVYDNLHEQFKNNRRPLSLSQNPDRIYFLKEKIAFKKMILRYQIRERYFI